MIEIKEDILEVLDKLEAAKQVLEKQDELDTLLKKLELLNIFLKRFGGLAELVSHLSFIERKMYMVKEYLTVQEAADFLNLSKSLVYKLTREHKLPIYKPGGKNVYIERVELNNWIKQHRIMSQEEIDELAEFRLASLKKNSKR